MITTRVAPAVIDATDDRPAKTVIACILYRPQGGHARDEVAQHGPGGVAAAVVHGHDFVLDIVQPQLDVQVFHGRGRCAFFVAASGSPRRAE
jgi:hypothetical protein